MTDIVEKLRNWATCYEAAPWVLLDEAADEIERLRALAAPSVPSVEPVAWMLRDKNGTTKPWPTRLNSDAYRLAVARDDYEVAPLYDAPQPAPAGWQLVPVVPTHAMVRAWRSQSPGGRFHEDSWIAMLEAAPAAPGDTKGT